MSSCNVSFSMFTLHVHAYPAAEQETQSSQMGKALQTTLSEAPAGPYTWDSQRSLGAGPIKSCVYV